MPTKQEQLNAILEKTASKYDGINDDLKDYAVKEIDRTRLELTDLLMAYANADDTINVTRINSLLTDLNKIKQQVYETGLDVMQNVITQSAEMGVSGSTVALGTAVGAVASAEITEDVFNRISAEAVRYVVQRFGEDGLVLSDRVWQLSGQQSAELESVIRSGIIRGESVSTLVAKVRRVYANETWKIKRLVITEGNVAYRTGSAYVAQQSKFVKGIRIHRGEADRPEHRCSQLEKIDRYGLGKGVFIPTDHEVLSPHVNCTSFVTYELVEDNN